MLTTMALMIPRALDAYGQQPFEPEQFQISAVVLTIRNSDPTFMPWLAM
jgi:hypothetical protein